MQMELNDTNQELRDTENEVRKEAYLYYFDDTSLSVDCMHQERDEWTGRRDEEIDEAVHGRHALSQQKSGKWGERRQHQVSHPSDDFVALSLQEDVRVQTKNKQEEKKKSEK